MTQGSSTVSLNRASNHKRHLPQWSRMGRYAIDMQGDIYVCTGFDRNYRWVRLCDGGSYFHVDGELLRAGDKIEIAVRLFADEEDED